MTDLIDRYMDDVEELYKSYLDDFHRAVREKDLPAVKEIGAKLTEVRGEYLELGRREP